MRAMIANGSTSSVLRFSGVIRFRLYLPFVSIGVIAYTLYASCSNLGVRRADDGRKIVGCFRSIHPLAASSRYFPACAVLEQ